MKTLIFLISLISNIALADVANSPKLLILPQGKPLIIAVIDTGFGMTDASLKAHLCKFGHKDFTNQGMYATGFDTVDKVPFDNHGHGTNIVGLIEEEANKTDVNYCIVVLKYYAPNNNNLRGMVEAIKWATAMGANVINLSGGGTDYSIEERNAVEKFLDRGGIFVAAAGNEKSDIDKPGSHYYPAMYDKRIVVVGNYSKDLKKVKSSNYGTSVSRWEYGENRIAYGLMMTGTSQACAVATGKIVGELKIIYDRQQKVIALRK